MRILGFMGGMAIVLMASCTNSKDVLISSQSRPLANQKRELRELREENKRLKEELRALEEEAAAESEEVEGGAYAAVGSQLNGLRNSGLSGVTEFISGGVERSVDVSASDMNRAIAHARTFLGTPHVTGGSSKRGIDCSGLIHVALSEAGVVGLPRTANEIGRYGTIIFNQNDLRRGDLIFFTNTYSTNRFITHVGICLGGGDFIHTSSSRGVMVSDLNESTYWMEHYAFGTRIIQ
jgi:cell wall-associated NlpC family hydrolase